MLLCSDGLSVQCHLSLFCRKERGCQKQHCEGGNYVALPLPVSLVTGLALKLGLKVRTLPYGWVANQRKNSYALKQFWHFFFSFLFFHYNYLKALSRLHQLKLLGHTLVVEFAKEQGSAQVLSQPLPSEKCKRYVDNNWISMFVVKERKFCIHNIFIILLSQRINCCLLKMLIGRFRAIPPISVVPFSIIM